MKYASVCSGVEAASLAWMPLGWEAVWFSEIDPFPCAVLKERFPDVPNLGDMTKIKGEKYRGAVDILVGGTPCQGFSVAGKQGGLNDPRSALCLAYCLLVETVRPLWFVWENVPGVFSSNGGADFWAFLRKIDEIGYSVAWRVLDAQYVRVDGYPRAVPQRRRRVFVVGYSGDWHYPAAVLFEPEMLHGNNPPRRTKRQNASAGSEGGSASTDWWDGSQKAGTLTRTSDQQFMPDKGRLQCVIEQAGTDFLCYENHAQDSRVKPCGECSPQINAKAGTGGGNLPILQEIHRDRETHTIAFRWAASPSQGLPLGIDYCHTMMANKNGEPAVCYTNARNTVRRLTPRECERLMGFPDNWTRIPWRGKPEEQCPDGPRYKACGNSMCVNVMRWIGIRIENLERRMKGEGKC